MIAKEIKYIDFDGVERTETHYFNLTETELIEWEYSRKGGMRDLLLKIINEKDQGRIIQFMQELIGKSYGERSEDGRSFIKSKKLTKAFKQTMAYNALFLELATDADKASLFVNGIMPKEVADAAENAVAEQTKAPAKTTRAKRK